MKSNFNLITELQTLTRRDFPVEDSDVLNPLSSNPLIDGEWLELNSNYRLARGSDEGTNPLVFVVHTERGRYDTRAIGKANVLYLGAFEAETSVIDTTSLVQGSPLTVQTVSLGGVNKRALKLAGATALRVIVGFVSRIYPATGRVRFVSFGKQQVF